jgi:hypothetical protein
MTRLFELAQLVHQRGEVAVARADDERGDVVALETSSTASTAILMSAAFLRTAPMRWGISISSTF